MLLPTLRLRFCSFLPLVVLARALKPLLRSFLILLLRWFSIIESPIFKLQALYDNEIQAICKQFNSKKCHQKFLPRIHTNFLEFFHFINRRFRRCRGFFVLFIQRISLPLITRRGYSRIALQWILSGRFRDWALIVSLIALVSPQLQLGVVFE